MRGMILAAGFGTRFRPVTFDIPKPMIPLCNRPLIDYAVEAMLAGGVGEIVVNLHHLPAILETHLREKFGSRCGLQFSYESEILGTGGAVRRARELLSGDDCFFLLNGDTVQFPPLRELEESRRAANAVAALLLRHPPDTDRFTEVFFADGSVTGIGQGEGEPLMFAGAHSLSSRIFQYLPERDFSGITEDVYLPLLGEGVERIAAVVYDGPWFDIGTPRRYAEASSTMRELMIEGKVEIPGGSRVVGETRSVVATSARMTGSITRSVLAENTVVEENAAVDECVIWHSARVGKNARVRRCILAQNVEIPPHSSATNALITRFRDDVSYEDFMTRVGDLVITPIDREKGAEFEIH